MVRCGRCAQVFDGFKTLATLPDAPAPAGAAPAAPPPVAAPEPEAAPPPAQYAPVTEAEPVAVSKQAVVAPTTPAIDDTPVAPLAAERKEPEEAAPLHDAETLVDAPLYDFTAPPKRRNGGWIFGVVLMLFALAAQAAYYYRSDIAASVPEARPHLNKLCELLHCTVALPQRPRQISIEASDMQATDPANPGLIALTATLRNHASTVLGYPALDVVLTNTKEHTVARRIFMPADYLPAGKEPRNGIAANAEVTIRLDLETGDLGAAGFRLDLIAAPAS